METRLKHGHNIFEEQRKEHEYTIALFATSSEEINKDLDDARRAAKQYEAELKKLKEKMNRPATGKGSRGGKGNKKGGSGLRYSLVDKASMKNDEKRKETIPSRRDIPNPRKTETPEMEIQTPFYQYYSEIEHPDFDTFVKKYMDKSKPRETMKQLKAKQLQGGCWSPNVYGECMPIMVCNVGAIVKELIYEDPERDDLNEHFFNLGSGTGGVVCQIAYMNQWKATGIEHNQHYVKLAEEALEKFKQTVDELNEIKFIKGDFLDETISIAEATVLFINNVKMGSINHKLIPKLRKELKEKTIIITTEPLNQRDIPEAKFIAYVKTDKHAMSWNEQRYTINFYRIQREEKRGDTPAI